METIIVSACLLGEKTRYDGRGNYNPLIEKIKQNYDIIPVCPEVLGGLSIPREPSELINGFAYSKSGKDVNNNHTNGAAKVMNIVNYLHIKKAILMDRSPSCGVNQIYNGYFVNKLKDGEGITTRTLRNAGVECLTIEEFVAKYIKKD